MAPLNMSYALVLHKVLGTYWLCIRPAETGVCGRPDLCEEGYKEKKKVKRNTHFVYTFVRIFAVECM